MELGSPGAMRQRLNALTLSGVKRATAGLLTVDYLEEGEELETPGEQLALVDDDGNQVATLRVMAVDVVPFDLVSHDFARSEGEGFVDHEDWAYAHRQFWASAGVEITGSTSVVCVRYTVVEKI